jgi:hypothetical protein
MFNQSGSFAGLGTYAVIVPDAGPYSVQGTITAPDLNAGDASPTAVQALVKVNSSTKYTGIAGALGFKADVVCAAGDTINVVLQSAADIDQGLNVIKTNIAISSGV